MLRSDNGIFGSILSDFLEPSPSPNMTTAVTNTALLAEIPRDYLLNLKTNVDKLNGLVLSAEFDGPEMLAKLLSYSQRVEKSAFSHGTLEFRYEQDIRKFFAPSSLQEASEKAKSTVEAVLNLLAETCRRERALAGDAVNDRILNQWGNCSADLETLPSLWDLLEVRPHPERIAFPPRLSK
jgi:hypothetical protein